MIISGFNISFWLIVLGLSSVSCSYQPHQREISSSFSCTNYTECFHKVDSLFNGSNIPELQWSELSVADSLINFHDYSELGFNATILVRDFIEVPNASDYLVRLGSDDGIRVFLNGKEIHRRVIGRSVKPDSDWIPLPMKAGLNEIIFQVNQRDGGWGLYYKIEEFGINEDLITEHIVDIYKDLPEACIIEKGESKFALTIDPRANLDTFHSVQFQWVDPIQKKVIWSENFKSTQLPNSIEYPEAQHSSLILEYFVLNQLDTVYFEQIPVIKQEFIDQHIGNLISNSDLGNKWKEGLFSAFEKELGQESKRTFSTRFKAEFLWDVLSELNYVEYDISGARTILFNGELAKKYTPYNKTERRMLGVHVEVSDSVFQYFDSYAGKSHSLMTEWNSYSQYYQVEILFPFINEQYPEIDTESTIKLYSDSVANTFSIVGWSKSTATITSSLENKSYNISDMAIVSPWVTNNPTENFLLASNIYTNNPQIDFYFYHGLNDTDVPSVYLENWIKTMNIIGFRTKLIKINHSSHWNYFYNPLKMYLNEAIL